MDASCTVDLTFGSIPDIGLGACNALRRRGIALLITLAILRSCSALFERNVLCGNVGTGRPSLNTLLFRVRDFGGVRPGFASGGSGNLLICYNARYTWRQEMKLFPAHFY
jgi:hypothetical protein